ncbi:MAG TPA: helix-turn-helix transcriptional regulator [Candidatus Coproplasma avistercoris]|nr:helix-turn-helix transcriptional regulator [Candidatus Coproplasma avistercoris]
MEIFAERLKELRAGKELSQRELAKATGLTQSAINLWENAKRVPNGTAIVTLAKFFGVTADYLLGLED